MDILAGAQTAIRDYKVILRMEAMYSDGEADTIKEPSKWVLVYVNPLLLCEMTSPCELVKPLLLEAEHKSLTN